MNDDPFARAEHEAVSQNPPDSLPDDIWHEIDDALGDVLSEEAESSALAPVVDSADGFSADAGIRQMQETFLELTRNNLNPVSRYVKAISLGEDARDLLEIIELVVTPLIPRVEAVGLQDHAEELSFFRSIVLLALGERDQAGTKAMREVVMEGFSKLSTRYDLKYRGYRLAVRNLVEFYRALRSSESVSELDVRRFFAVGVPSLTWVRRTRVSDMTSLSGIEPNVMSQIRELAYQYRSVTPMASAQLVREDLPSAYRRDATVLESPVETEAAELEDAAIETMSEEAVATTRGQA